MQLPQGPFARPLRQADRVVPCPAITREGIPIPLFLRVKSNRTLATRLVQTDPGGDRNIETFHRAAHGD